MMLPPWRSRVMRGVGFAPEIVFSLLAKKLHFSLIWPDYLLPYVWGVSHMPLGKHQTCLLIFFFKQWLFFWPLFRKTQLCGVYCLKWVYTPISAVEHCSSFRVMFGLFVASLINALLAWSVSFGGQPSFGRFVVVPYTFNFLNNGFNGTSWDVQCFWYFFITLICTSPQLCPWPVWRAPWCSWCRLLCDAPCLVVLQTLGPFRTGVYILRSCDGSCDT
jgi:hypothetical protein